MSKMPVPSYIEAFSAFEKQLRMLCLDEFPCGTGSWRSSESQDKSASKFTVTLKDHGASKEPEEVLEELVTSKFSPYSVDYSWSQEAKELREIAVKSPWLISREFILNHFQTLRIVDKNVYAVDSGMLQFKNLSELTLSVNRIRAVDSRNLPRSLKVLELVANEISDLEPLCNQPPELHHLGLGLNKISAVHDYLTKNYWPSLLSLDLSYNNLSDLKDIVQKLQTLPKLRNLALIGNPLAFIPGYRGFVIDSMRKLSILDDTQISADEKHHFKGLARRKEYVQDEAYILIKIQALTGIPKPPEIDPEEEMPEFPVISRSYYVEFLFLEDFASKTKAKEELEEVEKEDTDNEKESVDEKDKKELITAKQNGLEAEPVNDCEDGGGTSDVTDKPVSNVPVGTFFTALVSQSPSLIPPSEIDENPLTSPREELKLKTYRTQSLPWSPETPILDLDYSQELIIDDLPALKECLKQGFQIYVKEDKVSSNPAEETADERASQGSAKKPVKDKDGGKPDKKDKGKEAKGDKGKKKKKEPELELVHSPPEVTVLGSYHLDLAEFVNGENLVQEVCTCIQPTSEVQEEKEEITDHGDEKKEKKKRGEAESPKTKKGKEAKDKDKEKDKGKKGTKPEKKESKAKRPSSGKSVAEEEEEEIVPLPPLTVAVRVELIRWNTAQDSIRKTETENKTVII